MVAFWHHAKKVIMRDDAGVPEIRAQRSAFAQVRNAEREYAMRLRAVARQVGEFARGLFGDEIDETAAALFARQMERYSELLRPWAKAIGGRMLQDVMRRDERAWQRMARTFGRSLSREIKTAPIGEVLRAALDRQVDLITSLPHDAAVRVHELVLGRLESGGRAGEIRGAIARPGLAKDILETGHVTISRANLIARTETARASTELTAARARHVGSEGYIWRTAKDRDVRAMHRKLEGSFHRWDDPPLAEAGGQRHHPGEFPNCRCWPEPQIPAYPE